MKIQNPMAVSIQKIVSWYFKGCILLKEHWTVFGTPCILHESLKSTSIIIIK